MDLRERLKSSQAVTDTVAYNEGELSLQLRRFSMAETATYYSLFEGEPLKAMLFLLKTVVLDEKGQAYFSDSDDDLILGSVDSVLKPIIDAFWKHQIAQGK